MEYFIGSISTLIILLIAYKVFSNTSYSGLNIKLTNSQSRNFELIRPALPLLEMIFDEIPVTQARKYKEKHSVKIIMVDNQAYWIENNSFYVADMTEDGIDSESIKTVDTMGMDDVELDKIMFIVDKLNEGKSNDSRSSGNSQF